MEKWSVWFDDLPVETGGFPLQTLKFAEGINAWSVFSLLLLFLFQPVDHSTSTRKHIYIIIYIYIIILYIYYYIIYIIYILDIYIYIFHPGRDIGYMSPRFHSSIPLYPWVKL